MKGFVDDSLRALVDVRIGNTGSEQSTTVTVWIDTAFDGFLVFPAPLIEELGLQQEALTEAVLADGRKVILESYVCQVEWFGEVVSAQVIANNGRLPLLGTEFLAHRRLTIDYQTRTVAIE